MSILMAMSRASMKRYRGHGFTLVELLVTISIISLLAALLMPALAKVRRHTQEVLGMNNMRTICGSVTNYAMDHRGRYPESVATIGEMGKFWGWQEPMMMIGVRARSPRLHRAMSEYLSDYIEDPKMMFCPNAPDDYHYLEESWQTGDEWDYPGNASDTDPLYGTYCFYWNYLGYLGGSRDVFRGPRTQAGGRGQSKLLISDYFGYDHWQSPKAFGSCEQFEDAGVLAQTSSAASYWISDSYAIKPRPASIAIRLHAAYTDGHVETYSAGDVIKMNVSITADGRKPYPSGTGPGDIFLPQNSLF